MFWEPEEKAIFGPEEDKWWIWGSETPKPLGMPVKLGKTSQHHNWPRYMDWPQIGPKTAIKQGKNGTYFARPHPPPPMSILFSDPYGMGGSFFYSQLELFCLWLSFSACSLSRCFLDALSHSKQKSLNCKEQAPIVSKKARIASRKAPIASKKAPKRAHNCKQRSSTVSRKLPSVSKKKLHSAMGCHAQEPQPPGRVSHTWPSTSQTPS